MKTKLTFTTTGAWDMADGFGCASLGLPGLCDNCGKVVTEYPHKLDGTVLHGTYKDVLLNIERLELKPLATIVLFGNAGGENRFMADLQRMISCPMVGGGAAIDGPTGRSGLITGGGEVAVFLITDERYTYRTVTRCIHDQIIGQVQLTVADPRTILTIDGVDAGAFLSQKRAELGLKDADFEHLTISDLNHVNAHLSCADGVIKSGRDVQEFMLLRYVEHDKVYDAMAKFYDDENAIVFGCAGLAGLLDQPIDSKALGLFLFGEVCTVDGRAEFGNLMLSKLIIEPK